jgi:predicted ribosomally synthesized peptide with SipW-like signal peptide
MAHETGEFCVHDKIMKKILTSILTIGGLGLMLAAGTIAYFADTELSRNNTYAAGTIEISVNENLHWTGTFDWEDIKPGKSKEFELIIKNEGENPLHLWKIIKCLNPMENGIIEPEQTWYDEFNNGNSKNDIQSEILYELNIDGQQIFNSQAGIAMSDIADNYLSLIKLDKSIDPNYTGPATNGTGILNPGGTVVVREKFIMPEGVENWAQSDKLAFVVELEARQVDAPEPQSEIMLMDNKRTTGDWSNIVDNRIALLKYKYQSPEFEYNLRATGMVAQKNYCLIYSQDPWSGGLKQLIAQGSSDIGGKLSIAGSKSMGSMPNPSDQNYPTGSKLWLLPCSSFSGTSASWPPAADWLFENWPGFINYREGEALSDDLKCGDYTYVEPDEDACLENEICGDAEDNDCDGFVDGWDTVCGAATLSFVDLGATTQFGPYHDYSNATARMNYKVENGVLLGRIVAENLKPFATYQIKLEAKPTCVPAYAVSGNDTANETLGLNGRWWNNTTVSNLNDTPANNDIYYNANSIFHSGSECIQGYLVWDFITADENGDATKSVAMNNSYHVLFCGDGTCGSTSNDNLILSGSAEYHGYPTCESGNVNGQIERAACGSLAFPTGTYDYRIMLNEESFHQGPWTAVMDSNINFEI